MKAERHERTSEREGYRAGHYDRSFTTTSGKVKLKMPKLKGVAFETAIIERYRRRESSVEEAIVEMCLAGVLVRRVKEAADKLDAGIEETLTYMSSPTEHWPKIRSNNVIERLGREIRRRTRVVETFPDGKPALMLVCARLRYVTASRWGTKQYMSMKHLAEMPVDETANAAE
mgnify:FL=1